MRKRSERRSSPSRPPKFQTETLPPSGRGIAPSPAGRVARTRRVSPAGLIFDAGGEPLTPTHASKAGRRYVPRSRSCRPAMRSGGRADRARAHTARAWRHAGPLAAAAGRERHGRAVFVANAQIADEPRAKVGKGFGLGVADLGGPRVRRHIHRYPRRAGQIMVGLGIGIATAVVWVRRAREGAPSARKQGQPKRSKLEPHRAFLMGLIEAEPDITLRLRRPAGLTDDGTR